MTPPIQGSTESSFETHEQVCAALFGRDLFCTPICSKLGKVSFSLSNINNSRLLSAERIRPRIPGQGRRGHKIPSLLTARFFISPEIPVSEFLLQQPPLPKPTDSQTCTIQTQGEAWGPPRSTVTLGMWKGASSLLPGSLFSLPESPVTGPALA